MPRRLALAALLPFLSASAAVAGPDFDRDVAPLLVRRCLDCHSGPEAKGKLDLSQSRSAFKGGRGGPAVMAGKPDDSLLWQRVRAGEMPPKKPLSAEEAELLRTWIASGAAWGA